MSPAGERDYPRKLSLIEKGGREKKESAKATSSRQLREEGKIPNLQSADIAAERGGRLSAS